MQKQPGKRRANWCVTLIVMTFLALFATACSSINTRCPALVTYSQTFQSQAASELDALPQTARVATMVGDYGKLRAACRKLER